MSTNSAPVSAILMPPRGLDEVISTFGDIFAYVGPDHTLDPRWQNEFLDRVPLPFPLPLSWDISRTEGSSPATGLWFRSLRGCLRTFRMPAFNPS